ncbi:MAG: hypothetical protein AB7F72_11065 [Afipia sp.]
MTIVVRSNRSSLKTNRALGMSATQHPQRPFASEDAMDARKGFPSFRIAPDRAEARLETEFFLVVAFS